LSAEIVKLNKFRKTREKTAKEKASEENKTRFGRTKAEKIADEKTRKRLEKHLDHSALNDKDPVND